MDCNEARNLIKRFLEIFVRKTLREIRLLITSELTEANLMRFAAAFYHIRECKEEKCSEARRELNEAIRTLEHNTELLLDEEGKLPFSY